MPLRALFTDILRSYFAYSAIEHVALITVIEFHLFCSILHVIVVFSTIISYDNIHNFSSKFEIKQKILSLEMELEKSNYGEK